MHCYHAITLRVVSQGPAQCGMPSSRNLGGAMRRPSRLLALQVKQLFPALCLLLVAVEAGRNR